MPTFEDIDNAWRTGAPNPYTINDTPSTTTTTPPPTSSSPPPLSTTVGSDFYQPSYNTQQPIATTNPQYPGYQATPNRPSGINTPGQTTALGDMFTNTFRDPNMYWNEYSQGRGAQFTEGAARAMAKAGRTGMLPTLQTLAHQDYMSNYLPQVRKDLAPGLGYENAQNANLTNIYGQQMDYAGKQYTADVNRYGQQLDYNKSLEQLAMQREDIARRHEISLLDSTIRQLDIDETTRRQIFNTIGAIYKDLGVDDREAFLLEMQQALNLNQAGNATLSDLISETPEEPAVNQTDG